MQYALVNGNKSMPIKGVIGVCPGCSKTVIAKCGNIKVHHWAHKKTKDCDPWWEPETEWHRDWKNKFPENFREVIFKDGDNFHRADIHTSKGVTLEFQNSPISLDELNSRDRFYKQLIWIVNALKFKENIKLTCNIPNPESPTMKEFSVYGIGIYSKKLMFMLDLCAEKSKIPYELSFGNDILKEVEKLYNETGKNYWMFDWKYKRNCWLDRTSPVFFDFGDELLYWLKSRKQGRGMLYYIHVVKKEDFIKKYST